MGAPELPPLEAKVLAEGLRAAGLAHHFNNYSATHIGRFSNDVWRLELDNGVRLIAKIPYRAARPGERADHEMLFYQLVGPRADLPIPRFVANCGDVLVLEHYSLDDFSFAKGPTPRHAEAAVAALADWHAVFWENPPEATWLPRFADSSVRDAIAKQYDASWQTQRASLVNGVPEFAAIGDALNGRLAPTLANLATPATLLHGDAHAENIPLAGGRAILLDWQDPQVGNPGFDLAVFLTMSFPIEARRKIEQDVVARYAARMQEQGYVWEDPWQDYRLGVLRRAARIVEIANPGFVSLPWVFRRSAVAAVDLSAGDLIC